MLAAASDRDSALQLLESASDLIADSARVTFLASGWLAAPPITPLCI